MAALIALLFVVGLLVGSFLNVVALRVPEGRSVVRPGSACPRCGTPIAPRDNVPVLSWLLLRGRCRSCDEPIGVRYPIVELLTAGAFAGVGWVIGASWVLPAYLWFVAVTLVLGVVDVDRKLIPNRILYPGTVVGGILLTLGAVLDGEVGRLPWALAAAVGTFVVLFVLAVIARGGFGFGDVKLGFLLGLFTGYLGPGIAVVSFVLAFLLGGVVSLGLLVTKVRGRKDAIPFGPYLVAGAYLAIAVGDRIVAWYLG